MASGRKTNKVQIHKYISFSKFTTLNKRIVLMLSLLVVAALFISPTGVQPGRKCKELEQWGLRGTVAIGKRMLLSGGGARMGSQQYLLLAIGASTPRVTRYDLSTEARNWHFHVTFDFKWGQLMRKLNRYESQNQMSLWVASLSPSFRATLFMVATS